MRAWRFLLASLAKVAWMRLILPPDEPPLGRQTPPRGAATTRSAERGGSSCLGAPLESQAAHGRPIVEVDAREVGHRADVLVAAAGEVHQDGLVLLHGLRQLHGIGDRMARFERRYDALGAAQV